MPLILHWPLWKHNSYIIYEIAIPKTSLSSINRLVYMHMLLKLVKSGLYVKSNTWQIMHVAVEYTLTLRDLWFTRYLHCRYQFQKEIYSFN